MTDNITKLQDDPEVEDIPIVTKVNIAEETDLVLKNLSIYIEANRYIPMICSFFKEEQKMIDIICRETNTPLDDAKSLQEILLLWPNISADTVMLGFNNKLMIEGQGLVDSIVVLSVTNKGIYSQVFPYKLDENGIALFENDAELIGEAQPVEYNHSLGLFGHMSKHSGPTSDLLNWLMYKGHKVKTIGDWTPDNIDVRAGH